MSIPLSPFPKALHQSSSSVFFNKPDTLQSDEDSITKYATSSKIEILIKELQEQGPLVALGHFGSNSYTVVPFKLKDKVFDQDIYGWKPLATRSKRQQQEYILILGAKKDKDRDYVYFTMAKDITLDRKTSIRQHMPSDIDTNIYVKSHKSFYRDLSSLYPSTASRDASDEKSVIYISAYPKVSQKLSVSEREYAEKLASIMPLASILDEGEVESRCKAIGQEIFDRYKKEAGGNSGAGRESAVRICESLVSAREGSLRKQYIERAWDMIGDKTWRWMA